MSIFQGVNAAAGVRLPDHMDLPCSDDAVVENLRELPEAVLLSVCLGPILARLHPADDYVIGSNAAIYWDLTDEPWDGSIAPDWFYVPGVPGIDAEGRGKRSYVMWQEQVPPLVVAEFSSNSRGRERDRTPGKGKFWVYEQAVGARYHVIFDPTVEPTALDVYRLVDGSYEAMDRDPQGHYAIPELGVSIGHWEGRYLALGGPWIRWYGPGGELLEFAAEQVAQAYKRADEATRRAEDSERRASEESRRSAAMAAKLRALGIDPNAP